MRKKGRNIFKSLRINTRISIIEKNNLTSLITYYNKSGSEVIRLLIKEKYLELRTKVGLT